MRRNVGAAMLLAAVPLAAALAARTTLDGHEVLVAQTAREMLARGDYLFPTFGGEPRLQKPPLAYWLAAAGEALFGANEIAARLPSAAASIAGAAFVALLAARWFGRRVGGLAGAVHATTWWTLSFGRMALVDAVLAMLVTLGVLIAAWNPAWRRAAALRPTMFGLVAGLIVLAKGPVGLALLLPPALCCLRGWPGVARMLAAALVFLPVALGWPAWIALRHPEALGIWYEQSVGRFVDHYGPQTRSPFYYVTALPWLLAPWTPFAAWGAWRAARNFRRHRAPAALLAWFGAGLLFCSLSAGKRAHYLLPALPPLSILSAVALDQARRAGLAWAGIAAQPRTFAVVAAGFAGWFAVGTPRVEGHPGGRALLRRHAADFRSGRVAVFGTNDHWPIFAVPAAPRWLRDERDLAAFAAAGPGRLLVPASKMPDALRIAGGTVIDRIRAGGSLRERDPREALMLIAIGDAAPRR